MLDAEGELIQMMLDIHSNQVGESEAEGDEIRKRKGGWSACFNARETGALLHCTGQGSDVKARVARATQASEI